MYLGYLVSVSDTPTLQPPAGGRASERARPLSTSLLFLILAFVVLSSFGEYFFNTLKNFHKASDPRLVASNINRQPIDLVDLESEDVVDSKEERG